MEQQFLPPEESCPADLPVSTVEAEETTDVATTEAQKQAITAAMVQARRSAQKRALIFSIVMTSMVLLFMAYIVLITGTRNQDNALVSWLSHFGGFLLLPIFAGLAVAMQRQEPPFDAVALTRMGGVKAVPILLDSLQMPHSITAHKALLTALTSVLPQMRASDASLLTAGHRRFLNDSLRYGLTGDFSGTDRDAYVLAILKAYEQVGDEKAIPVVEQLAKRTGNSARRVRLREAAQACLPLLQSNRATVDATRTLLRASRTEPSSPDMLLRAATSATASNSEELLRATEQPTVPPDQALH